ncbi:DUF4435 domain-containing protein [Anaerotignum sp.]|uniref:DUF4435 domain-containing protein n=1 Tax=Anaerotignum sp. TaxID=2039241 RepID=UPI0028A24BD4|nr:DUF4435 domain-containing protein [Anaerotignum sp.]
MQNNSIKSNLTKDDIISEIRLTLGADIEKKFVYIVVEGEDDIKFLRSELNDYVYLYESYDGKNGVEAIAGDTFGMNNRVIGIRDRDYSDFVNGTNAVFSYDNSCMEMMFLADEIALQKICCEFYLGNMSHLELRYHVLIQLRFLSCVRKLNEKRCWNLNFKGVSIPKAYDCNTFQVFSERVKNEIKKVNQSELDCDQCSEIDLEVQKHNMLNELLLITQGHDFTNLFATICNNISPRSRGISGKTVEECLRCAYSHLAFRNTKLYEVLNSHQDIIGINFLML